MEKHMKSLTITFLALLTLLSGCVTRYSPGTSASYYYLNPHKPLVNVGRTALVELNNNSAYPNTSSDVTQALYAALQKKQLFGLTVIPQDSPEWDDLQLDPNSKYSIKKLATINKKLSCDAVLKGTVTSFTPFPNMVLGMRLELIDLTDGELLWAIEQIWDSSDKNVEDRIKKYYRGKKLPLTSSTLQEKLGTTSSRMFIKFAAYETAETLLPGNTRR
jgi:hypothetical protein